MTASPAWKSLKRVHFLCRKTPRHLSNSEVEAWITVFLGPGGKGFCTNFSHVGLYIIERLPEGEILVLVVELFLVIIGRTEPFPRQSIYEQRMLVVGRWMIRGWRRRHCGNAAFVLAILRILLVLDSSDGQDFVPAGQRDSDLGQRGSDGPGYRDYPDCGRDYLGCCRDYSDCGRDYPDCNQGYGWGFPGCGPDCPGCDRDCPGCDRDCLDYDFDDRGCDQDCGRDYPNCGASDPGCDARDFGTGVPDYGSSDPNSRDAET
ncbi:hypothetical protein ALC53_11339 [Atta colombica]|uniref:Uncharacterized protein n=1 Tax=Atta colombica TaxID=520822 RepID=A0A151HZZ5_9HYME|nr:hypothetical protein ALC53_11339 [Atta colombica]